MRYKNIIKPVLFIGILLLLLYLLSFLFIPQKSDKDLSAQPKMNIDYMVIGDSASYTSISPMEIWEQYGIVGYNCGVPGQRIQDTCSLLQNNLEKQVPKVVLFEINATFQNFVLHDEVEKTLDTTVKKGFPIYEYHSRWKELFPEKATKETAGSVSAYDGDEAKGFPYKFGVKPYKKGEYVKKTDEKQTIQMVQRYYLDKILRLCNENNIELILYSSPSPACWTYEKHNAAQEYAQQHKLRYVDMNLDLAELQIDWNQDTFDEGDHLNFKGAQKTSAYMGKYLAQTVHLENHKSQKEYQSWVQALAAYKKHTAKGNQ